METQTNAIRTLEAIRKQIASLNNADSERIKSLLLRAKAIVISTPAISPAGNKPSRLRSLDWELSRIELECRTVKAGDISLGLYIDGLLILMAMLMTLFSTSGIKGVLQAIGED